MVEQFDCYVGVDWSGDKRAWQKGLKVAIAYPGRAASRLECGPAKGGQWSRTTVAHWIVDRFQNQRALIGLDFAFGFPPVFVDENMGLDWDYVERICERDANFYGGAFFRPPKGLYSRFTNSPWLPRESYSADYLRQTEVEAKKIKGARPQSVFNAVGAAQVGPSSISGMRVLRFLKRNGTMCIWPFDDLRLGQTVVVEIFPRYFSLSVGRSSRLADHHILNQALAAFQSEPTDAAPQSEDDGDALLSATALRALSTEVSLFQSPDQSVRRQGWIFGVPTRRGD